MLILGLFWLAVAAAAALVIGAAIRTGQAGDLPTKPDRTMVAADDLFWLKTADTAEGPMTLGLLVSSGGTLAVLVDDSGQGGGLILDRAEVQELRDALTRWLVDSTVVTR